MTGADTTPQIPAYSLIYKNLTVHYVLVYAMDEAVHQQAAADITTCLKGGVLHHIIAGRFGLDEIAAAHELLESGTAIGNLVLLMN